MSLPPTLRERARDHFDLTEPADQERLLALAEALGEAGPSREDLRAAARDPAVPLELKLAAKLVESRRSLLRCARPLQVAVVFAMWGEQNRLLPKAVANPHGEDLLRVKLRQLDEATKATPVRWRLYAVDDGCPHGSSTIAKEIAGAHPLGENVQVLSLADALPAPTGPLRALPSADASQKGGAVILGCLRALAEGADAVVYTDADLSVHLGQIGLLVEPFVERDARVVLGNRKHPEAVLVKQESRWGVGIKLLRHMQRRVGAAIFETGILDTQAAFKLYGRGVLEQILSNPTVYDFSFDTDWIAAVVAMDERFEGVPFAFIDSFAESASIVQGPMTTWLVLLKGLLAAVRARGLPHDEAMARVLDEEIQGAADLELLIDTLPPELAAAADEDLGRPDLLPADAVRAWIEQRRGR